MCEADGSLIRASKLDEMFHEELIKVQASNSTLIDPSIEVGAKKFISRSCIGDLCRVL